MKLIIEGTELTQAIRRGLDFEVPRHASINITSGRGTNPDRAEIDWSLDAAAAEVAEEPPFEVDDVESEIDPAQQALPIEGEADEEEEEPLFE